MPAPIQNIIKHIPNWNPDSVEVIQELSDSITSTSYLLKYLDQKYVLRIDKSFDQGVIPDRVNELKILEYLDKNHLCNKLVHADLDKGLLLTEFIEAIEWSDKDINKTNNIIKLAFTLKVIHTLTPKAQAFDLLSGVRRYAETLQTEISKKWANEIISLYSECENRPAVLCHNDLHSGNIIESDKLIFIDWEYAGLGNPLFDVSSILQYHQLSDTRTELFLNAYCGEVSQREREDIQRFKSIQDRLLALWLSLLLKSASDRGMRDLESEVELVAVMKRMQDTESF